MEIDKLELSADGRVHIKYATKVYDVNGIELVGQGRTHREVIDTDEDTARFPADVKAVLRAHWTPTRKAARAAKRAEEEAKRVAERAVVN